MNNKRAGAAMCLGLALAGSQAAFAVRPTLLPDPLVVIARQAANYGADSVADFNHDGLPDVAVPGIDWGFVDILLGRGDGTFQKLRTPHQDGIGMAIGDFDSDGHLDFASGRYLADPGFWVFLGLGDGTFQPGVQFNLVAPHLSTLILQLTTADFDGDGHLDVTVYDANRGVFVAPGNGDGTFGPPGPLVAGGYHGVGDFDGDQRMDLACKQSGQVCLHYGLGDGSFQHAPARDCVAGGGTGTIAVGDLNGDGRDDVVAGGSALTAVFVQANRALQSVTLPLPFRPLEVELARLDADDNLDIVASSYAVDGSFVATATGRGDGTFHAATVSTVNHHSGQLEVADFDQDGNKDLGAVSSSGYTFAVIPGRGDGTFPSAKVREYDGGSLIAGGDVDNDGDLDLVSVDGPDLLVRLGDGRGGFDLGVVTPLSGSTSAVLATDLDGDGRLDVVLGDGAAPTATLLFGAGDGTFGAETTLPLSAAAASLDSADFNGDGQLDLAVGGADPDETIQVLLGQGGGVLGAGPVLPVGAGSAQARRVIAADLDGDGNPDLVTTNPGADDLSVYLGFGAEGFGAEQRVFAGTAPVDVATGDFDRDGRLDLVVCVLNAGTELSSAVFLPGLEEGGFGVPRPVATTTFSNQVAVGDFDGDGRLDLVLKHSGFFASFTASVLLGNGDGTFRHHATHPAGFGLLVGDFDHDRRDDLATGGIYVLLNQGPFTTMFERDSVTLAWPPVDRAEGYDVYRGILSELSDADDDGAADGGYGTCRTGLDPDPSDNSFVDDEVPPPAEGYFYLYTARGAGFVPDLGTGSSGSPRLPTVACP